MSFAGAGLFVLPEDAAVKFLALAAVCCVGLPHGTRLWSQSAGPGDRAGSDPRMVVSTPDTGARAIPIDDLFFTQSISYGSWSPDGKEIVFASNISGRSNLWKVGAAGGWPVQLIQSDERQASASSSPGGKWIAYQQDFGGNELWDIYGFPSDGGEAIDLTQTPDNREESPHWSPDDKTIALNYKPKENSSYDLALLDFATRKVRKLTHETSPSRPLPRVRRQDHQRANYQDLGGGDPVKDRAVYDAASPITYIHAVKAPLLVLQGGNDPRLPKEQATQVVELLKQDGKIVDAHYDPNEGHGFSKRENQIDAIRRTVEWFDKYLKGAP